MKVRVGVRADLLHLSQVELLTEDDPELLAHSHIKQVDVLVRVRVRVTLTLTLTLTRPTAATSP